MFSRNAPPSILSRGCRYILRTGHHHRRQSQSPLHFHSQSQSPSLARPLSLSLSLSLRTKTPSSLFSQLPRTTPRAYSTIHTTETTTMADASETGVSADSLRAKLIEQLQAQYVEIEDLSGTCFNLIYPSGCCCCCCCCCCCPDRADNLSRRMRSGIHGDYRLAAVREQEYAGQASVGECGAQVGDCGDSCVDAKVFYAGAVVVNAAVIWDVS